MRRLLAACALLAAVLPSWGGESRTLAALLSTALPGAGQAYLGWRGSAQAFLVAEGMVWGSRYYLGRRSSDDIRQIKRWKAMRRHVAQLQANCATGDLACRRVQRQALLHWAYDSRVL